jgi:ribosomal protein L17
MKRVAKTGSIQTTVPYRLELHQCMARAITSAPSEGVSKRSHRLLASRSSCMAFMVFRRLVQDVNERWTILQNLTEGYRS